MTYLIDTDRLIDHLAGAEAATALKCGLTLVTRNRDDYRDIPGLTIYA